MATPQGDSGREPDPSTPGPDVVIRPPWWRRWLPTARTTTDKDLDASMRPAPPRVGSWDEQKDAGARWTFIEWLFRFCLVAMLSATLSGCATARYVYGISPLEDFETGQTKKAAQAAEPQP